MLGTYQCTAESSRVGLGIGWLWHVFNSSIELFSKWSGFVRKMYLSETLRLHIVWLQTAGLALVYFWRRNSLYMASPMSFSLFVKKVLLKKNRTLVCMCVIWNFFNYSRTVWWTLCLMWLNASKKFETLKHCMKPKSPDADGSLIIFTNWTCFFVYVVIFLIIFFSIHKVWHIYVYF